MMGNTTTTTQVLGKPDQVHLDSAFETAASNQTIELPMRTSVLLSVGLLEDFNDIAVRTPDMRISEPFMHAVADTREPTPATFDIQSDDIQANETQATPQEQVRQFDMLQLG